ncbi:AMP-binding protein [Nocardia sp. NPDC048505]|uniref:AMP-binding protein n=1 Tax=unclassified Nocardia TaxID=2637762 RepID=UPI0033DAB2CE
MITRIAQAVEGFTDSFDRAAILDDDCLHTYDLLAEAVELLAGELRAAGVRGGDRVSIYMRFGYPALLAALAVNYAGAVAIPLDIRETCALTERKLRVAGAHWVLGHLGDDHIVEDVAGLEDPPMVSVAGEYTLLGLPGPAGRAEAAAGFAFCTPEGSGCRAVDTAVLADTAQAMARQWGIGADDTVALGSELGEFEGFLAATATLVSGATLCLPGRTESAEHWHTASVLVHADIVDGAAPPPPEGPRVEPLFGRWSAESGSARDEIRELRFPTRPQGRAERGQVRRCG